MFPSVTITAWGSGLAAPRLKLNDMKVVRVYRRSPKDTTGVVRRPQEDYDTANLLLKGVQISRNLVSGVILGICDEPSSMAILITSFRADVCRPKFRVVLWRISAAEARRTSDRPATPPTTTFIGTPSPKASVKAATSASGQREFMWSSREATILGEGYQLIEKWLTSTQGHLIRRCHAITPGRLRHLEEAFHRILRPVDLSCGIGQESRPWGDLSSFRVEYTPYAHILAGGVGEGSWGACVVISLAACWLWRKADSKHFLYSLDPYLTAAPERPRFLRFSPSLISDRYASTGPNGGGSDNIHDVDALTGLSISAYRKITAHRLGGLAIGIWLPVSLGEILSPQLLSLFWLVHVGRSHATGEIFRLYEASLGVIRTSLLARVSSGALVLVGLSLRLLAAVKQGGRKG
ncbi:hypothetical protein CVT26_012469 [Gymnopilus dilepis]|uniref:Uncharacterized protein n=1 Tax=Gymnopilus dilepis TaxID=231916 RepID=A0A409YCQ9_9AGAR|nr:hypothetical protein CVT26_012469 [Gymnopilus dilepis]